jgi:hypothetical protein
VVSLEVGGAMGCHKLGHKVIKTKGGKFRIRHMKGKSGTKKAMKRRLAAYHMHKKRG